MLLFYMLPVVTKFEIPKLALLKLQNQGAVYLPGYFDFDYSDEPGKENSRAKFAYIDMSTVPGKYSGIGGAVISFPSDINNPNSFDATCSKDNPLSNICQIPCNTLGKCKFRLDAPVNSSGRFTMRYWVRTVEREHADLFLSTKYAENLVDPTANPPRGAIYASQNDPKQFANYSLNCITPYVVKWQDWRLLDEETRSAAAIPGAYSDPLHPIIYPNSVQLVNPPVTRVLPNLLDLGGTLSNPLRVIVGHPLDGYPASMSSWNYPNAVGGGSAGIYWMREDGTGANFPTSRCEEFVGSTSVVNFDLTTGDIVADFASVPDRPVTTVGGIERYYPENPSVAERVMYIGSFSGDLSMNGFSDGDNDGPGRIIFPNPLPASIGTITLSPTPPGTAQGMGADLPIDGQGRWYIPPTDDLNQPGCIMGLQRCKFYFHPVPGYSGEYTLNYLVASGADLWESDNAPGKIGKLKLIVGSVNDAPTVTWIDAPPRGLTSGTAPAPSLYRVQISEGGYGEEANQTVAVLVESSNENIFTAELTDVTGNNPWIEPVGDATSVLGKIKITPKADANGTATLKITLLDNASPPLITVWQQNITVMSANAPPTILAPGGNSYEITEDIAAQPIRIVGGTAAEFYVGEGSGDADFQQVVVTFESNNQLIIPNSNINFSRTDNEGDFNSDATFGNILVTPITDAVTTTTPVSITMKVKEANTQELYETQYVFTVAVKPVNDLPTVSNNLQANSPFTQTEGNALVISGVSIDEGGGPDEDAQLVAVQFVNVDTSLIQSISFSRSDSAGVNMGAATGNITIVPMAKANGNNTITLRATDSEGGVTNVQFTARFTAVNDPPVMLTTLDPDYTIAEDTVLTIPNIFIDEGGVPSGNYNEDSDMLFFNVSSSNTTIVPNSGIIFSPGSDNAGDSSIVARTLSITPAADANGSVTITISASDGTNNNVFLRSFLLTITPMPDSPKGNISCNPAASKNRADGTYVINSNANMSARNIVCSGITDPDGDSVSYNILSSTCGAGVTINAASGKLEGTMAATDCTMTLSAVAGGQNILIAQRKTISFYIGNIQSAGLAPASLSADDQCLVTAPGAAGFAGQAIFDFATATSNPAGFSNLEATANQWKGVLTDFSQNSYSLNWAVTSTAGDSITASVTTNLTKSPITALKSTPFNADLLSLAAPGTQPDFVYPTTSCSSKSQCDTQPKAHLALGLNGTCVINSTGKLACFGENSGENLGVGSAGQKTYATEHTTLGPLIGNVIMAGLGEAHGCALGDLKKIACWGDNTYGQLGTGNLLPSTTPQLVPGISTAVAMGVGKHHSCALLENGTVSCWGRNNRGQAGNSANTDPVQSPAAVSGLTDIKALSAGSGHNCAWSKNTTLTSLLCWGDNSTDQLGLGSEVSFSAAPSEPAAIAYGDFAKITALALGGNETGGVYAGHSCVALNDGTVTCWGSNSHGQLGSGSLIPSKTNGIATAVTVKATGSVTLGSTSNPVIALAGGGAHTCALRSDRTALCWGQGTNGQLANGSTANRTLATQITPASDYIAVSAGLSHTCLMRWGGGVTCAGERGGGRLGNGNATGGNVTLPVTVETAAGVTFQGKFQRCERISLNP